MKAIQFPSFIAATLAGCLVAVAGASSGAAPAARAKIPAAVARATALSHVSGGQVQSEELEDEHGRLVWSFDISKPGSRDVVEIQIDANTGRVVVNTVESPAAQAAEARAERTESAAKAGSSKAEPGKGAASMQH